jgi:hypothetical protein
MRWSFLLGLVDELVQAVEVTRLAIEETQLTVEGTRLAVEDTAQPNKRAPKCSVCNTQDTARTCSL